jgi:hypothetical protein
VRQISLTVAQINNQLKPTYSYFANKSTMIRMPVDENLDLIKKSSQDNKPFLP